MTFRRFAVILRPHEEFSPPVADVAFWGTCWAVCVALWPLLLALLVLGVLPLKVKVKA